MIPSQPIIYLKSSYLRINNLRSNPVKSKNKVKLRVAWIGAFQPWYLQQYSLPWKILLAKTHKCQGLRICKKWDQTQEDAQGLNQ